MARSQFKVVSLFFDRSVVKNAMDSATYRALVKAGSFIRTRARSSMRRRKRSSLPGAPPSVHVGFLKNFLFFSYDPTTRSVVVGPEKLNSVKGEDIPNVLEFGGTVVVRRRGKAKRVKIAARNFMGPALEAERGNLPSYWNGQLKQ